MISRWPEAKNGSYANLPLMGTVAVTPPISESSEKTHQLAATHQKVTLCTTPSQMATFSHVLYGANAPYFVFEAIVLDG